MHPVHFWDFRKPLRFTCALLFLKREYLKSVMLLGLEIYPV